MSDTVLVFRTIRVAMVLQVAQSQHVTEDNVPYQFESRYYGYQVLLNAARNCCLTVHVSLGCP